MCISVLPECLCTIWVPDAHRCQKLALNPPRTGAIEDYDPPYGCWEQNPGPLQ